jgi:hypothetical protein
MDASEVELRIAAMFYIIGLYEGEVRARLLSYCFSQVGIGWDEEYGGFRRIV